MIASDMSSAKPLTSDGLPTWLMSTIRNSTITFVKCDAIKTFLLFHLMVRNSGKAITHGAHTPFVTFDKVRCLHCCELFSRGSSPCKARRANAHCWHIQNAWPD